MEGLLAAAILGVATVAVVGPIITSRQQTEAVTGTSEALALARQMLEEIASRPYADPDDGNIILGPDLNEPSREWFDNVDDYHGYADSTRTLKAMDGSSLIGPREGKRHFLRSVTVEYRAGPAGPTVAAGDFAVVKVTVTPEEGDAARRRSVELSGLVTRVSLRK